MAEVASNVQQLRQLPPMQVLIGGMIESSRVHLGAHYTTIVTPARSEFDKPSVVEIKSTRRLGESGARMAPVICEVSGYVKQKPYIDEKTKEAKVFRDSVVYFTVLE